MVKRVILSGVTYLTTNLMLHAPTKHIEVDFHFVREQVAHNVLHAWFISTNQLANISTKALSRSPFNMICDNLNFMNHGWDWGRLLNLYA